MAKIRLQGDARSIADVMGSISEVLATAEDLLEDGDSDREVAMLMTSFLKTLLVQLDEVLMSQGHLKQTAPSGEVINKDGTVGGHARRHKDCLSTKCLLGHKTSCPHSEASRYGVSATKRPIPNKYDARCRSCHTALPAGNGYVLPAIDPKSTKKWHAFCDSCHRKVNA